MTAPELPASKNRRLASINRKTIIAMHVEDTPLGTKRKLRKQLSNFLSWHDAHADFEAAVANLPAKYRRQVPPGLPYSPWQLLEHLRLAQRDILDYCTAKKYEKKTWPDDYWPTDPAPPSAKAWDKSVAEFKKDRAAFQNLIADEDVHLSDEVPNGKHSYLREVLLAADHASYHIGQLIYARRVLGAWKD
jgi:hypothetical protein